MAYVCLRRMGLISLEESVTFLAGICILEGGTLWAYCYVVFAHLRGIVFAFLHAIRIPVK